MRRAILCLLAAFALGSPGALSAPLPRLSQIAARHQDAIVRVLSVEGRVLSSGFFVAGVGYAIAAVPEARVGDGVVVELSSGARRRGVVVAREEKGPLVAVSVSAASDDEWFATLPLGDEGLCDKAKTGALSSGWLVALCHDEEGRVMPAAGGVREREKDGAYWLDLPCGRGAAVLAGERVVGVTVRARGATASSGVGVERVRALSRGLAPKRPTELLPSPREGTAERPFASDGRPTSPEPPAAQEVRTTTEAPAPRVAPRATR